MLTMIKKLIVSIAVGATFVASPSLVSADGQTCVGPYGSKIGCPSNAPKPHEPSKVNAGLDFLSSPMRANTMNTLQKPAFEIHIF